jgi:hypothetical protein
MNAIDKAIEAEGPRRTKFWSVKRIADRWCCSHSKVYQLIYPQKDEDGVLQAPRLPSIKFDGMVRVRAEDLEEFERCNTTASTGSANTEENGSRSTDVVAKTNADLRLMRIAAKQARTKRSGKSAN